MHELLETYVSEVGRRVPANRRPSIEKEARRLIEEALAGHHWDTPSEDQAVEVLNEIGSPGHTAAELWPHGQYLIGPGLYPIFRTVAWIVVLASTISVLAVWMVELMFADSSFEFSAGMLDMLNIIPASLGSVVLVFAILQRFGVSADPQVDRSWDPHALLPLLREQRITPREHIVGISIGTLLLMLVAVFPERIGLYSSPGGEFFVNPVIGDLVWWIAGAIVATLALNGLLLWRGRWENWSRIGKVLANAFAIVVFGLLVQGHIDWLNDAGANWFIAGFPEGISGFEVSQIVGMQGFNIGFAVAGIVTFIETLVLLRRGWLAARR